MFGMLSFGISFSLGLPPAASLLLMSSIGKVFSKGITGRATFQDVPRCFRECEIWRFCRLGQIFARASPGERYFRMLGCV